LRNGVFRILDAVAGTRPQLVTFQPK
jgi:hypothetical protein